MARLPDSLTFLRVSGACAAHAAPSKATDTSSGVSERLMGDSLCEGGRRTSGVSTIGCATAGTVSRPFSPSKRGLPKASRPQDPLLEWRILSRGRMRRGTFAFLLLAALMGGFSLPAAAARPETVELKGAAGSVGRLPRVQVDDGGSYVAADKLTALLKGSWSASGPRATLTVGKRSAQLVRDQPRVVIQGQTIALDAAPRMASGSWLIPEDFLVKGLPKLVPGVAAAVEAKKPAPVKPVQGVSLEELRYRSYPSFTRIVVEADAMLTYSTIPGREEVRVRLPRLAMTGARVEEIGDGLVKEVRLEPSGVDAVLRVVLEGQAGEVKASALQDPFRLVLDVYRPKSGPGAGPGQPGIEPLRLV